MIRRDVLICAHDTVLNSIERSIINIDRSIPDPEAQRYVFLINFELTP